MASGVLTDSERKLLGRFDTPRPLAQALADWAIRDGQERVLEPSCGGGVIVKSIIARFEELGAEICPARIFACDVDSRALSETRKAVAPHSPELVLRNFLTCSSSTFQNEEFGVVLGNPPYVRLHTMSKEMRDVARRSLPPEAELNAKASLWAYFPIYAFQFLALGGRMGWILPETLLHSEYGKQILTWAAARFERCVAVSLREHCFLVDGAKERVVILLLEGAGGQAAGEIEMIEFTTAAACIAALPGFANRSSKKLPKLNGHAVPHLISASAVNAANVLATCTDVKAFGELADVKIGVVTGRNDFFVLSDEQRKNEGLATRHFKPVVSKFTQFKKVFLLDESSLENPSDRMWLLCPNPKSADKVLAKYLRRLSKAEIVENKTMAKRPDWQVPELGGIPDAFLQCMGKWAPRLVLNEGSSYCTNTIHRVFFKAATPTRRRAICLSVHSTYSQLSAEIEGRQYGSGVLKLEPSEARRILIPFNDALEKALSESWPHFSDIQTSEGWSGIVSKIDAIVVAHCPNLAKTLPLREAQSLLQAIGKRRTGRHLARGT